MRKFFSIMMVITLVVMMSVPAFAGFDATKAGFERLVMSPKTAFDTAKEECDNTDNKVFGAIGATVKGGTTLIIEALAGFVEVALSPLAD